MVVRTVTLALAGLPNPTLSRAIEPDGDGAEPVPAFGNRDVEGCPEELDGIGHDLLLSRPEHVRAAAFTTAHGRPVIELKFDRVVRGIRDRQFRGEEGVLSAGGRENDRNGGSGPGRGVQADGDLILVGNGDGKVRPGIEVEEA